jgi:DNA polymerase-3 subunit alpha (Gram-positive type)
LPPEPVAAAPAKKKEDEGPVIVFGRNVAAEPVPMKNHHEEQRTSWCSGQIVSYEERQQRSGGFFVVMTLTDYGDSVEVKLFHEGTASTRGVSRKASGQGAGAT